ncbi:hypothetical protein NE237_028569 [Protea cynaroides]|uniref:RING-type domain-containing protein n=1 Tax=Protea cynaroides TaxID=273540 RepID=A0A9Q0JU78_9MAGN|nr:hypothetical protein NE237_028569 [Protea cynaroides]
MKQRSVERKSPGTFFIRAEGFCKDNRRWLLLECRIEDVEAFLGLIYRHRHRSQIFRDCIAKYIETKLEERVAKVPCPAMNCEKLLDPLSCRWILSAGLFEKWCVLLCDSAVRKHESAYCPFTDCSALILNECRENITRSECPNCKKFLCFQCKLP